MRIYQGMAAIGVSAAAVVIGAGPAHATNPDINLTAVGTDTVVTVPAGMCSIDWVVIGGSGGSGGTFGAPGKGGQVVVTTEVTPGDQLLVQIGEAGAATSGSTAHGGRSGSQSSGGSTPSNAGGGGGATVVRSGATTSAPRLIVAGGGGGGGRWSNGGDAGATGTDGDYFDDGPGRWHGGGGATGSAPGAGGIGVTTAGAFNGNAGSGATGASSTYGGGGGGGGGYYGGGSGAIEAAGHGAGGGGGANLAPAGATTNGTASTTGNGSVTGTYHSCPIPHTPAAPTASAGTSSIRVTWSPPSSGGAPVTGYTAVASPGPATCTTTTALTCVLGARAGTTYTVVVIAHSATGDSSPSPMSNPVTPTAPVVPGTPPATSLTLTTDRGHITTATRGQHIVVIGTGFAPYSTAVINIYSAPTNLGTVVTNSRGNFSKPVTIPAGLAAGSHTVVAQGVAPNGSTRAMKLAVTVAAPGGLPSTGDSASTVAATGCALLLVGAALCLLARRRHGSRDGVC